MLKLNWRLIQIQVQKWPLNVSKWLMIKRNVIFKNNFRLNKQRSLTFDTSSRYVLKSSMTRWREFKSELICDLNISKINIRLYFGHKLSTYISLWSFVLLYFWTILNCNKGISIQISFLWLLKWCFGVKQSDIRVRMFVLEWELNGNEMELENSWKCFFLGSGQNYFFSVKKFKN